MQNSQLEEALNYKNQLNKQLEEAERMGDKEEIIRLEILVDIHLRNITHTISNG